MIDARLPILRTRLLGLACVAALIAGHASTGHAAQDTQFANYAFASELGSGIYESGGRTIQVYQLPLHFTLRRATEQAPPPGIDLILPVTVGFFNFKQTDLVRLRVPTHIGALSIEPGAQLDYWLNPDWHVYPYAKVGGTFASATDISAMIYGVGTRSDFRFRAFDGDGLYRAELAHAGVHFYSNVRDDSFTRLRDGVEWRRNMGWSLGSRQTQFAAFGVTDVYFDAPSGPASGISAKTVQYEAGLMFGVSPMWQIHGIDLPRIGVGYRIAGELSGWRLVIGDPF